MKKFTKRTLSIFLILLMLLSSINMISFAGKPVKLEILEGSSINIETDPSGTGTFVLTATDKDVNLLTWSVDSGTAYVNLLDPQSTSFATFEYINITEEQVIIASVTNGVKTDSITVTLSPSSIDPEPQLKITLTGDFKVNETIHANYNLLIEDSTYIWQSSNANKKGKKTTLDGSVDGSYTIKSTDLGRVIRVIGTATVGGNEVSVTSDWSTPIAEADVTVAPEFKFEDGHYDYNFNVAEDSSYPLTTSVVLPDANLTYSVLNSPTNGTVTNTGSLYTYTPYSDFNGNDSFTIKVEDQFGGYDTAVVNVVVDPVNDEPFFQNTPYEISTEQGESDFVTVSAYDVDGDVLTYSFTEGDSGTVTQIDTTFTYTSDSNFIGNDSFTVTVNDGNGGSDETVILVTVDPLNNSISYVALGDSIPYGRFYTSPLNYLFGGTDTNSYVEQIADYYNVSGTDYDQSISGLLTVDMLNLLTPGNNDYNSSIENQVINSDVITLCVGANDIMEAAPRTFSGLDKYNIDDIRANVGRDDFELYWPQVIDRIHELNDDVTLVVMTVFNPYRDTDDIYGQIDQYFTDETEGNYGLNYIINKTMDLYGSEYSSEFKYLVADVYTEFNSYFNEDSQNDKDELTGFYNDDFCDPHPNQLGQNLIYNAHLELIN